MSASESETTDQWATAWFNTVAGGLNTMSQRKLTTIEKHEGGLDTVKSVAEKLESICFSLRTMKEMRLLPPARNPSKFFDNFWIERGLL